MNPINTALAVISCITTLLCLGMTAINAWSRQLMKNEILQLRVYVSDNYVSNHALSAAIERLEKLVDRLERRMDGGRGAAL